MCRAALRVHSFRHMLDLSKSYLQYSLDCRTELRLSPILGSYAHCDFFEATISNSRTYISSALPIQA